jgi:hypothetical protein
MILRTGLLETLSVGVGEQQQQQQLQWGMLYGA